MRCFLTATLLIVLAHATLGSGIEESGDMAVPKPEKPSVNPEAALSEVAIDQDNKITRTDASGKIKWSTTLEGHLGSHREPHLLVVRERVYLTHGDGITALDGNTGKILWHEKGPGDRLFLSNKMLLATECGSGDEIAVQGRWLTARAVDTGKEVFKVRLPGKDFDPLPIREVASLFLIQISEHPNGKGNAYLIDRKGAIRHRFDRQILDGRILDGDRIFVTSKDMVRVSPDDKIEWTIPFKSREWIAGGGFVDLPGGDLVTFLYGGINDSGVQVVRLNPCKAKVLWQVHCQPLGVSHSKYRHEATVVVEEKGIRVTSRGSFGTFVELDLPSGRQLERTKR